MQLGTQPAERRQAATGPAWAARAGRRSIRSEEQTHMVVMRGR